MLHYSRLQLATIVAVPIVSIVLIWTVLIFYKNRKSWRCFDTAIVAIIIQSILRNISIIIYTVLQMLNQSTIKFEYCTIFVWIFNSIHTFQASTLSTLAVIALFSIRLYRKKERLKNYLTVAHMVYHLFCLTTLCACVGVAAILAKQKNKEFVVSFDFFPLNLCKFMPYEMDVKYNVFIITLHAFLGVISLIAFILTCYNFYACKSDGFDYVKKSNSDLSELSLGSQGYPRTFLEVYKNEEAARQHWTSDMSNISTTVSSTNSRRPCLGKRCGDEEVETVGLETILPILTVCYLFNHIPVIVLCLFPWFIAPWSVATAALCLGLLQDILVPLSLGLVDTRFCQWVSNVYRCSERENLNDKLPQVGLDGKFRPFGVHNPEMDISQTIPERQKIFQTNHSEPKFPITNGSLYTSIDGRVPIIHNYRRHKDRGLRSEANHLINLGVHATYLRQQELTKPLKPQNMDYPFLTCPEKKTDQSVMVKKRVSLSQNGLNRFGMASVETKANIHQLRLSKSEDSLDEIEREGFERKILLPYSKNEDFDDSDEDFSDSMNVDGKNFDSDSSRSSFSITTEANGDFDFYQADMRPKTPQLDFVSSHEHETFEYLRTNLDNEDHKPIILQTFKPQRITSNKDNITVISTEPRQFDVNRNFRITRSNSKRSLESFKAFLDSDYVIGSDKDHNNKFNNNNNFSNHNNHNFGMAQRSFSYVGLDETKSKSKFESAWSGIDLSYGKESVSGGGSVPDLKRIFISDYL